MASPMTPRPPGQDTTAGLYAPPDLKLAYCTWAANCGPAAFAAVTRRPLMSVGKLFPRLLAHASRSTGWRVRTALEVWPPAVSRGTAGPAVPG